MTSHTDDPESGFELIQLRLRQFLDHSALTRNEGTDYPLEHLIPLALSQGRVLLQAPPGAGKSTVLRYLYARRLPQEGHGQIRYVWLLADKFRESLTDADPGTIQDVVFDSTQPRLSLPELRSPGTVIFLMDAFDELPFALGNRILQVLEDLANRLPHLSVIVADRPTRRPVSPNDWALVALIPANSDSDASASALGSAPLPFMRKVIGATPSQGENLTAACGHYFASIGQSDDDVRRLSEKALTTLLDEWSTGDSIGTPLARIAAVLDLALPHLLLLEFLLGTALARNKSLWQPAVFDVVTNNGTSLETLIFAAEQCPSTQRERYVSAVHDWNFYVCLRLLARSRYGPSTISPSMEIALIAMMAEKQFDIIAASARDASDILNGYPWEFARSLAKAHSIEDVVRLVSLEFDQSPERFGADWFPQWSKTFSFHPGSVVPPSVARSLRSRHGIVAWTAANVLRRSAITTERRAILLDDLNHSSPLVRWRATHALGSQHELKVAQALVRVVRGDQDSRVRYGALRSAIEAAYHARSDSRARIFSLLAHTAGEIAESRRLSDEVARDLSVSSPPSDWAESAGLLIEALWSVEPTVEGQDKWRVVGAQLRETVRSD